MIERGFDYTDDVKGYPIRLFNQVVRVGKNKELGDAVEIKLTVRGMGSATSPAITLTKEAAIELADKLDDVLGQVKAAGYGNGPRPPKKVPYGGFGFFR